MMRLGLILSFGLSALLMSCALFEPREPEPPSQSGSNFEPPYSAETVISNLKNAIAAKNLDNYIVCFSGALPTQRGLTFVPSAPARAQYSSELSSWDREKERAYMQNLISHTSSNAFSSLSLVPKSFAITTDSVVYNYTYTFTFHHDARVISDSTARGELWFTLGQDNTGLWSIYRWLDYPLTPTSTITTWSSFKGGFS
ncbi:MAG TPA: hypothetical protein DGH68_11605, partial [Bacteroidetes bacterium]|nr:hypothetical protein [Bacteroidota bacterium]